MWQLLRTLSQELVFFFCSSNENKNKILRWNISQKWSRPSIFLGNSADLSIWGQNKMFSLNTFSCVLPKCMVSVIFHLTVMLTFFPTGFDVREISPNAGAR